VFGNCPLYYTHSLQHHKNNVFLNILDRLRYHSSDLRERVAPVCLSRENRKVYGLLEDTQNCIPPQANYVTYSAWPDFEGRWGGGEVALPLRSFCTTPEIFCTSPWEWKLKFDCKDVFRKKLCSNVLNGENWMSCTVIIHEYVHTSRIWLYGGRGTF
jgi:hypothetical protein